MMASPVFDGAEKRIFRLKHAEKGNRHQNRRHDENRAIFDGLELFRPVTTQQPKQNQEQIPNIGQRIRGQHAKGVQQGKPKQGNIGECGESRFVWAEKKACEWGMGHIIHLQQTNGNSSLALN